MDFISYLLEKYNKIEKTKKSAFFIIFIFGCILYSYQAYNFTIGYHSYYLLEENSQSLTFLGRFSSNWFNALTMYQLLPILNVAFPMFALALGSIFIGKILHIPDRTYNYVLLGLFLVSTPHSISWIYFSSLSNYFPLFFIPFGLWLLTFKNKALFVLSSMLFLISFGIYQPAINTFAILFLAIFIDALIRNKFEMLKTIKEHVHIILSVLSSLFVYLIMIVFLTSKGIVKVASDNYMTNTESLFTALIKLPDIFIKSVKYFIFGQTYFEIEYKAIVVLICICASVALFIYGKNACEKSKQIYAYICVFASMLLFVLCTNLSAFIHVTDQSYLPRHAFYGYVPLVLVTIGYIIKSNSNILKNVGLAFVVALIYLSTLNTLYVQRNWEMASERELSDMQEAISRIEANSQYSPDKTYYLYMIGQPSNFIKQLYYGDSNHAIPELAAYTTSQIPGFSPYAMLQYLGLENKFIPSFYPSFPTEAAQETQSKILKALKSSSPWPHTSSVQVIDDVILVIWNKAGLDKEIKLRTK